jgi:hypothetical protein
MLLAGPTEQAATCSPVSKCSQLAAAVAAVVVEQSAVSCHCIRHCAQFRMPLQGLVPFSVAKVQHGPLRKAACVLLHPLLHLLLPGPLSGLLLLLLLLPGPMSGLRLLSLQKHPEQMRVLTAVAKCLHCWLAYLSTLEELAIFNDVASVCLGCPGRTLVHAQALRAAEHLLTVTAPQFVLDYFTGCYLNCFLPDARLPIAPGMLTTSVQAASHFRPTWNDVRHGDRLFSSLDLLATTKGWCRSARLSSYRWWEVVGNGGKWWETALNP